MLRSNINKADSIIARLEDELKTTKTVEKIANQLQMQSKELVEKQAWIKSSAIARNKVLEDKLAKILKKV